VGVVRERAKQAMRKQFRAAEINYSETSKNNPLSLVDSRAAETA